MTLIRCLIRTFVMLLVAAFGPVAGFAAQGDWSRASYPSETQELSALPLNLTYTALY